MSTHIQETHIIPEEMAGLRIDQAVAKLFPEYSRARLQGWLKSGELQVDGKTRKAKEKVDGGEQVSLDVILQAENDWIAEKRDLDIIYEDKEILVINKPIGLVVHPGAGNPAGTLLNALLGYIPELNEIPRAGIVHRLDKDTSGLMVIAKTLPAQTSLVKQLEERSMHREYEAIVYGYMIAGFTVDEPIGRHARQRTKMAVTPGGKEAVTHVRVIEHFNDFTHIEAKLETGRTHQIRVHLTHKGYPLVGDQVYGARLKLPKGASDALVKGLRDFTHQALHARALSLTHPKTGERLSWNREAPEDFMSMLEAIRLG